MCGIAGVVYADPERPVDQARVQRMCDVIRHRGPDEEGFHVDGQVGLGVRRLRIIDLATGQQPIHNEDKTVWV
ncbi:MAG TPA: asparagine synthetase B, partial [Methylomirabilota bacterium]|nr:asparagine synthetase B [Methylomirabilota bacterium]